MGGGVRGGELDDITNIAASRGIQRDFFTPHSIYMYMYVRMHAHGLHVVACIDR